MGFNSSSGQVQAVFNSTAGLNLLYKQAFNNGNGSTTIGTVPAGKIWKIFNICFAVLADTIDNVIGTFKIDINTVLTLNVDKETTVGSSSSNTFCLNFGQNYIVANENNVIAIANGSNGTCTGAIFYIEEDM